MYGCGGGFGGEFLAIILVIFILLIFICPGFGFGRRVY